MSGFEMIEITVLILNIGLIAAALWLNRWVSGSVFSKIPKYLIVLGASMMVHSASEIWALGRVDVLVYYVTALIASLAYLMVVYGVFVALGRMPAGGQRSWD
jgi:hypothetical protein